jgi:hypothetical protein
VDSDVRLAVSAPGQAAALPEKVSSGERGGGTPLPADTTWLGGDGPETNSAVVLLVLGELVVKRSSTTSIKRTWPNVNRAIDTRMTRDISGAAGQLNRLKALRFLAQHVSRYVEKSRPVLCSTARFTSF